LAEGDAKNAAFAAINVIARLIRQLEIGRICAPTPPFGSAKMDQVVSGRIVCAALSSMT
jgi:hypothetical protein